MPCVIPCSHSSRRAVPRPQVTLLFFAGLLFRFDDMPGYWQWYAYLDFLRYAWSSLMINQFRGVTTTNNAAVGPEPIRFNGFPILEYYSIDQFTAWQLLGYEALFFFGFFGLAWAALQFSRLAQR
jgi:ABC-2 type transporter